MKLSKYYSLDECNRKEFIYTTLDELQNDGKLEYTIVETDVIKVKDTGLSKNGVKEILFIFNENDVISYPDYEEEDSEFEDDEFDNDSYENDGFDDF